MEIGITRDQDGFATGEIFRRSVAYREHGKTTEALLDWLAERAAAHRFQVEQIPFERMIDWGFDPETGNMRHRTGRFFTVEGLSVAVTDRTEEEPPRQWAQPILVQPEHAILGMLMKNFDGVPHFLMQAKIEPGNANRVQLSPTVQATRSNYTRVHNGASVRYVEHFLSPPQGSVVVDVLQSELAWWFHHKTNRNMIVQVEGDIPVHEDFIWLTLGELAGLLLHDNVINMDARSVLSCLPVPPLSVPDSDSDTDLLPWLNSMRARHSMLAERVPLAQVADWIRGTHHIEQREAAGDFRVIAVSCQIASREVRSWTQPLLQPVRTGLVCFLARRKHGKLEVLARARVEPGFVETVELGPTIQGVPGEDVDAPPGDWPELLQRALSAQPEQILYDTVLSEEGGRCHGAGSRYLVVEIEEELTLPSDCRWVTPGQLSSLLRRGRYVNVQGRSLLTCLNLLELS